MDRLWTATGYSPEPPCARRAYDGSGARIQKRSRDALFDARWRTGEHEHAAGEGSPSAESPEPIDLGTTGADRPELPGSDDAVLLRRQASHRFIEPHASEGCQWG